jgi:3-methyladenine DNA glycosylase AlkD
VIAAFEAARDPARAAAMSAYLRGQFPFLGLPGPERVAIERPLLLAHPAPTGPQGLRALVLRSWGLPEREYQYFGIAVLRRHLSALTPAQMPTLRHLITTKSWWDTVDELATHVVGDLARRHPELRSTMDEWIASENIWLARAALLHRERWRESTDADLLFAYSLRRAADREFFIRKAIGWALRSYARTRPEEVEVFLRRHGDALSALSRREALRGVARGRDSRAGGRRRVAGGQSR